MANFIRNKYNSLDEQVEENKHNIDELINIIKEPYTAHVDLGDNSITVLISDTNASSDVVDGWLFSQDGYLYKINGGDGTNLLIEFYASFKGDQGDQGDQGIQGERGYSIRYYNGDYIDNTTPYFAINISPLIDVKNFDLVLFKNGYIATITNLSSGGTIFYTTNQHLIELVKANVTLDGTESDLTSIEIYGTKYKVGGGSQFYQHNIKMWYTQSGQYFYYYTFNIINSDDTPFTTKNQIASYLYNNGFVSNTKLLLANGQFSKHVGANDYHYQLLGIYSSDGSALAMYGIQITPTGVQINDDERVEGGYNMQDVVVTL